LFGDSLQVDIFAKHKNVKQKDEPNTEDFATGGDSKKSVNILNSISQTAFLEAQIKES
jgi:hypothetical protein